MFCATTHPYGVSRVLAARMKLRLAMNFTESAFNKSARRLATLDGTQLSSAQEKLASVLGFSNYDAARKALLGQASPVLSTHQPGTGRRWMGLSCGEMLALASAYMKPSTALADSGMFWAERSESLARLVFFDVFSRPGGRDVMAAELSASLDLGAMLRRYTEITEQGEPPAPADRGYVLYIDSLLGFSADRSKFSTAGKEQHLAIANPIHWALNSLAFVEMAGPDDEKVLELLAQRPRPHQQAVRVLLHAIEERVRFGTQQA